MSHCLFLIASRSFRSLPPWALSHLISNLLPGKEPAVWGAARLWLGWRQRHWPHARSQPQFLSFIAHFPGACAAPAWP